MPTYPEITELVISNFKSIIFDTYISEDICAALTRIIDKLIELFGKEHVAKLLMTDSDEDFHEFTDEEFEDIFQ